jgi:hypothetical protein
MIAKICYVKTISYSTFREATRASRIVVTGAPEPPLEKRGIFQSASSLIH